MKLQSILNDCLIHWKKISGFDFTLLHSNDDVYLTTALKKLPATSRLQTFREGTALSIANTRCCLYKIFHQNELLYLLIVWGSGENASVIGELAVYQIQSLLKACL